MSKLVDTYAALGNEDKDRIARGLIGLMELGSRFAAMTDEQLADLILENIWAFIPLGSPAEGAFDQIIARLRRAKGGALNREEYA